MDNRRLAHVLGLTNRVDRALPALFLPLRETHRTDAERHSRSAWVRGFWLGGVVDSVDMEGFHSGVVRHDPGEGAAAVL
ncbi:MAG: hypothetical protein U9R47_04240 [Actinomycetota bacterium]|nr:hypothetical protein [Actinomycetota bacterium]